MGSVLDALGAVLSMCLLYVSLGLRVRPSISICGCVFMSSWMLFKYGCRCVFAVFNNMLIVQYPMQFSGPP